MLLDIILLFSKSNPWLVLLNVSMMAFVPINEILLPYLYGKIINNINTPKAVVNIITVGVTILLIQGGFLLRDKINEIFIPKFESYIKTQIVDMILKKYNNSYDNLTTGDIIYKLTKIPDIIIYWFQWLNDYIIPYFFVFLSAIIFFAKYDLAIMLTFIIFLIILVAIFFLTPAVCVDRAKKNDVVFSNMHEKVEDIIHNMPSIYGANTTRFEINMLGKSAQSYSNVFAKTAQCTRNFKTVTVPLITAFVIFFLLRSKHLIKTDKITSKAFVPAFVIVTSMLGSIFWIVDIMRFSVFDLGVLTNMDTMLKAIPMQPREVMKSRPVPNSIIGLENVSFGYGKDELLKNITIHFETGKSTALVGPIGAGKTTIMKLLLGFYIPQKGDCYIKSKWYRELSIESIRNMIGYVPQNPVLFNDTVLYNIQYGNKVSVERIIQVMKELKLPVTFLYRDAGKNGMNLSGGQRQLVWCLRIFFKNPDIILMDEPTASMDNDSKDILLYILNKLMKNKTVILVSHDPYMLNYVDRKVQIG